MQARTTKQEPRGSGYASEQQSVPPTKCIPSMFRAFYGTFSPPLSLVESALGVGFRDEGLGFRV